MVNGAKHSLPGDIIEKSEGPPIAGGGPSEIQISEMKLYPNEEFSIQIRMIFNVDSNCVHPRFRILPPMVAFRYDFIQILEIFKNNSTLKSRFMKSSGVRYYPW